jgi:hypothetical protein
MTVSSFQEYTQPQVCWGSRRKDRKFTPTSMYVGPEVVHITLDHSPLTRLVTYTLQTAKELRGYPFLFFKKGMNRY